MRTNPISTFITQPVLAALAEHFSDASSHCHQLLPLFDASCQQQWQQVTDHHHSLASALTQVQTSSQTLLRDIVQRQFHPIEKPLLISLFHQHAQLVKACRDVAQQLDIYRLTFPEQSHAALRAYLQLSLDPLEQVSLIYQNMAQGSASHRDELLHEMTTQIHVLLADHYHQQCQLAAKLDTDSSPITLWRQEQLIRSCAKLPELTPLIAHSLEAITTSS